MDPNAYHGQGGQMSGQMARGGSGGQMPFPVQQAYPYPQPGMPAGMPPLYQQQQIRLARYPGEALHGPPPPLGMGQYPQYQQLQQQQMGMPMQMGGGPMGGGPRPPLQPQLAPVGHAGGMMGMGPGGPQGMAAMQAAYAMQAQSQGMGPGGGGPMMMGLQGGPYGGMPPGHQPMQRHPSAHQQQQQQQQGYAAAGGLHSGAATPKPPPGSGAQAHTAHSQPHQRPPSGSLTPFQAQTVPAPPGVNLPDSLSPGSPVALRMPGPQQAQQPSSSPVSRAQSASQLVPLSRSGSQQGLAAGFAGAGAAAGAPRGQQGPGGSGPKPGGNGHSRAGSAHSVAASTRSAAGGGSGEHSHRRGGSLGGAGAGGGPGARLGSGKLPTAPNSRVGSASKRSAAAAGELDEFDNIKVAVRVRPPNAQELARADPQALFVNPNDYRQIQLAVPGSSAGTTSTRTFTFHACLGPTSRQADVIRLCGINQLLDAALDGFNATVMAFGQTGSGKTYTMSGKEEVISDDGYMGDSNDGIMTRSAVYLFEQQQRRNDGCKYSFRVSYLEIYNEAVYDLLKFDKRQLQVRWDATKGFYVPELTVKECHTLEDLLRGISRGMRHRRVGSHELNLESSRSHSIMTIYCDVTPLRQDDHEFGTSRFGKVSLVDLAGSERVRDSKSSGETLKETTNINRSLFTLGKVISSLAEGAQGARVPYRDSKLTRLLMDSLGGSSLSLIIACCSPSAAHAEETLSTLTYASRAKNIRNQPLQQVDPQEAAIAALKREVRLLRAENAYLREQLFHASMPRPPAPLSRLPSAGGGAPGTAGGTATQLPSGMVTPFQPAAPAGAAGAADTAAAPPAGTAAAAGPLAAEEGGTSSSGSSPAKGEASRPGSAGRPGAAAGLGAAGGLGGAGGLSAAQAGSITSEELLRRLLETQRMLVQFSRENDRLAGENDRLRAGKTLVATDYQGALEEVEWLRNKLESLESSLLRASLDASGAAAGAGAAGAEGRSRAAVVEAAVKAAAAAMEGGDGVEPADAGAGSMISSGREQEQGEEQEGDAAGEAKLAEAGAEGAGSLEEGQEGLGIEQGAAAAAAGAAAAPGAAAPGAALQGGAAAKPPLIAPELLQDPSELQPSLRQGNESPAVAAAAGAASPDAGVAAAEAAAAAGGGSGEEEEEDSMVGELLPPGIVVEVPLSPASSSPAEVADEPLAAAAGRADGGNSAGEGLQGGVSVKLQQQRRAGQPKGAEAWVIPAAGGEQDREQGGEQEQEEVEEFEEGLGVGATAGSSDTVAAAADKLQHLLGLGCEAEAVP